MFQIFDMKKISSIIILLLITALTTFITTPSCYAVIRTVSGTVTKVSDGDTIHLTTPEQTILKVRLYGIDAPETDKINQRTGHITTKAGRDKGDALKLLSRQNTDVRVQCIPCHDHQD
jgi:endonuclease YncB( thermonuclease family)